MVDPVLPAQGSPDDFVSSDPSLTSKGSVQPADQKWYYLKVTYRDDKGALQTGYAFESDDSYWQYYMVIKPGGPYNFTPRFRKSSSIINPDGREWDKWQLGDDRYLSVRSEGWMKSQVAGANPPFWNGGFNGIPLTNGWNNMPISILHRNAGFYDAYWLYGASNENAAKCEWEETTSK